MDARCLGTEGGRAVDGMMWAALSDYLSAEMLISGVKSIVGLGLVIFVHELGHFLAAKACGVKCEKFYVGFDVPIGIGRLRLPRSLARFRWGETEYGIGILPLGGYVKMLGQDDDPRNAKSESDRIKMGDDDNAEQSGPIKLDPRSFPAKSVPQRMLIISAGVIMNILFAVIFAAIAYRNGLPYTPCVVGNVLPAGPAWNAGVRPGDRILQIGREGAPSDHLRFDWDLIQGVGLHGAREDLQVLVRRAGTGGAAGEGAGEGAGDGAGVGAGKDEWLVIRPRILVTPNGERPTIGITSAKDIRVAKLPAGFEHLPETRVGLQTEDEITAVNGQNVANFSQFQQAVWQSIGKPVELTVKRGSNTQQVTLPPLRRRGVGLEMKASPVVAIRPGSPAAAAGFQVGDELVRLDGQPVGDMASLPFRLAERIGSEVEFTVRRKTASAKPEPADKKETATKEAATSGASGASDTSGASDKPAVSTSEVVLKSRIVAPDAEVASEEPSLNGLIAVESLGIAYRILNQVAAVEPDSPAAKAGFQTGDTITTAFWQPPADKAADFANTFRSPAQGPMVMDESREHWLTVDFAMQVYPPDTKLTLEYKRDGELKKSDVAIVEQAGFLPLRTMMFTQRREVHVAESISEALSLGVRQTKEDMQRVVAMITRLLSGRVSAKNLGGPVSILIMATSEASFGYSRLLLFLTFLSANLAVLNFLPIPALDGGHMLFLAWEGIFRRPVNERVQIALTMFGVCCLLGLMVFVFGNDLWRLSQ